MRTLEDDIKILEECGYNHETTNEKGIKMIDINKVIAHNGVMLYNCEFCSVTLSHNYPSNNPLSESPLLGKIYRDLIKDGIVDDELVRYINSVNRDNKINEILL